MFQSPCSLLSLGARGRKMCKSGRKLVTCGAHVVSFLLLVLVLHTSSWKPCNQVRAEGQQRLNVFKFRTNPCLNYWIPDVLTPTLFGSLKGRAVMQNDQRETHGTYAVSACASTSAEFVTCVITALGRTLTYSSTAFFSCASQPFPWQVEGGALSLPTKDADMRVDPTFKEFLRTMRERCVSNATLLRIFTTFACNGA